MKGSFIDLFVSVSAVSGIRDIEVFVLHHHNGYKVITIVTSRITQ